MKIASMTITTAITIEYIVQNLVLFLTLIVILSFLITSRACCRQKLPGVQPHHRTLCPTSGHRSGIAIPKPNVVDDPNPMFFRGSQKSKLMWPDLFTGSFPHLWGSPALDCVKTPIEAPNVVLSQHPMPRPRTDLQDLNGMRGPLQARSTLLIPVDLAALWA
jgi:hypothetical protein